MTAREGRRYRGTPYELTRTELVHLRLAAEGLGAKQAAERLVVAYDTVRNHRRAIREKMGGDNSLDSPRLKQTQAQQQD